MSRYAKTHAKELVLDVVEHTLVTSCILMPCNSLSFGHEGSDSGRGRALRFSALEL